ncbi:MAG: hypothetical protein GC179_02340 [Anaerolineaceae bacterium]|nr:hypothetical protein [Anaerolineaceae bacterium]
MKKHFGSVFLGTLIYILFAFNSVLAADQAYFTTDNTTPLIGEPIQLVLHIRIPTGAKLVPPDFTKLGVPFFVKEVGSLNVVGQADGNTEYQLPLIVILWQTGQYSTPPLIVSYQLGITAPVNLTAESIQFVVPSILNESDLSLRPLKPQIDLPYFPVWMVVIVLAIAGVLAYIALRYRLIRRVRVQLLPNNKNDKWHPKANAALMSLKQFGQSADDPQAIYVQVSACIRQYLDVRFTLQASDLTTNELLATLAEQQIIVTDQQQKLADMLKRADLVKFAKVVPKLNVAQQYASIAAQWIQSVEQTQAEHTAT